MIIIESVDRWHARRAASIDLFDDGLYPPAPLVVADLALEQLGVLNAED